MSAWPLSTKTAVGGHWTPEPRAEGSREQSDAARSCVGDAGPGRCPVSELDRKMKEFFEDCLVLNARARAMVEMMEVKELLIHRED